MIEHRCKSGLRIKVDTNIQAVADKCFQVYEEYHHLYWACPFCGTDIDAVMDERSDGIYEDTYGCENDNCRTMITFISPMEYGEYHNTPTHKITVLVEFLHGNSPVDWEDLT